MRLSHARRAIEARFDDPNLVSCAGLVAVMALADRCGLAALLVERLRITAKGGANAATKVLALVAGMVCGADSIDDLDLLRHGGMGRLFTDVRAPSTLGTFLRSFSFGHVRQLDAVAAGLLTRLAAATAVLPENDKVTFVDVDDTVRQTYGYAKQGAGRGYTGINGHISMNWRGRPLTSHDVIVNTIAATTTSTGLSVHAELDTGTYPSGIKIPDKQMKALHEAGTLRRHDWHPEWNYTLEPPEN